MSIVEATKKAIAVIGANYGDEGKGATVHHLARRFNIFDVVRFNGGSQAGHTVQINNGARHIFHTYGSASLIQASTWYTEDVLYNPAFMAMEKRELADKGFSPHMARIDPNCIVVTPWDIALNQFKELARGNGRHGSCGQGINEAVTRQHSDDPDAPLLLVSHFKDPGYINEYSKLGQIWYRKQIQEQLPKLVDDPARGKSLVEAALHLDVLAKILMKFMTYVPAYMSTASMLSLPFATADTVIFEGAQGLLLDENDKEHFPHVTRSTTGITNVAKACTKAGRELTDVYYVTRPYLTRHGRGPILKGYPCGDLWDQGSDKTNVFNDYQEGVSFAHLDWGKLKDRIQADLSKAPNHSPKPHLVITCSDQISNQDKYLFHFGDEIVALDPYDETAFADYVSKRLDIDVILIDGRKGTLK